MVCGIIADSQNNLFLYTQDGSKLYKFPITWSNQQTVPARGRRSPEVAELSGDADEDVEVSAVAVMWTADSAAVVVLAALAVMMVADKAMGPAKVKGDDDLFVDASGKVPINSPPTRSQPVGISV
jgi:hypothetical protein